LMAGLPSVTTLMSLTSRNGMVCPGPVMMQPPLGLVASRPSRSHDRQGQDAEILADLSIARPASFLLQGWSRAIRSAPRRRLPGLAAPLQSRAPAL
jgi:hypothetical protein